MYFLSRPGRAVALLGERTAVFGPVLRVCVTTLSKIPAKGFHVPARNNLYATQLGSLRVIIPLFFGRRMLVAMSLKLF